MILFTYNLLNEFFELINVFDWSSADHAVYPSKIGIVGKDANCYDYYQCSVLLEADNIFIRARKAKQGKEVSIQAFAEKSNFTLFWLLDFFFCRNSAFVPKRFCFEFGRWRLWSLCKGIYRGFINGTFKLNTYTQILLDITSPSDFGSVRNNFVDEIIKNIVGKI